MGDVVDFNGILFSDGPQAAGRAETTNFQRVFQTMIIRKKKRFPLQDFNAENGCQGGF